MAVFDKKTMKTNYAITMILKSLLLTLLFNSIILNLSAQDCDCLTQFSFVKKYFENNNPAFQKIKNSSGKYKNYTEQLKILTDQISKEKSSDRCNIYFEKYIRLLKDHHSGIDFNIKRLPIDLNSQKSIDSFKSTTAYKAFKRIKIDTVDLIPKLKLKTTKNIEGIYTNGGSLYFGIIKSKPDYYIGVILRKTNLLDIGHVLLKFKKIDSTTFDCVYHTGLLALNFQNIYTKVKFVDGQIPEFGFSKINTEKTDNIKPYEFWQLDSSTNYLKLTSFDRNLKQELDSFYKSIDISIQSKPYLIIDLRDNGGGAEECYFDLIKYVYTKPLHLDQADVWVSPDNIKRYEEAEYSQKLIDRMKNAEAFSFISQIRDTMINWTMKGVAKPKKVALLFNGETASAAEGMIVYCMQSNKVITLGENSGGYLGYGDVMSATIPCGKYSLRSTTTKYVDKSKYEFIGIKPEIQLSEKQDWVDFAKRQLEEK